jgi:hypothetical protein
MRIWFWLVAGFKWGSPGCLRGPLGLSPIEAEGSEIPSAVPMEDVAPGTQEAAAEAPELMEVAAGGAAATTEGGGEDALPEPTLEVVVRSPEIQYAEPIRSAPMTEAATSSRGGIDVVWTSLGPLPRWVPGPTTRWAPGTTRLALHGT